MNTRYVFGGIAIVVLLVGGVWWTKKAPAPTPNLVATSTVEIATSTGSEARELPAETPKTPVQAGAKVPFALVSDESVSSWDFAGTHKDGGKLEAQVRADIERLKGLLSSGKFTNYELYISIANQYDMLGDGQQEYTYLGYALSIDAQNTGLAWRNMGKLLARLGAYKSARVAYNRMVEAQPLREYELTRLEFHKTYMPNDTEAIKEAEARVAAAQD
jgi:tetratricopeptide (TPR) repeat protein